MYVYLTIRLERNFKKLEMEDIYLSLLQAT